jgi:hypothetical protein
MVFVHEGVIVVNRFKMGIFCMAFLANAPIHADMGRVYHPYVELNERELEYGLTVRELDGSATSLQRLGIGYAWAERFFTEIYVLSESIDHNGERVNGYEVELKWQLTEQGEFWSDWGLLFEAATDKANARHEIAAGILWEKEVFSRWTAAANVLAEMEFGSAIENEFETSLRGQMRYRHSFAFEPAVELYLDDKDWAAGPAMMGAKKLSVGRQIKWEMGLLLGLDQDTPDVNLRANLEFEF